MARKAETSERYEGTCHVYVRVGFNDLSRQFFGFWHLSRTVHRGFVHAMTLECAIVVLADMCRFMRELVLKNTKTQDLNVEERNLLSVAYKNVIGARRATWRTLNETIMQESQREDATFARLLHTYKLQVDYHYHVHIACKSLLTMSSPLVRVCSLEGADRARAQVHLWRSLVAPYRSLAQGDKGSS
jgi:hypothetical protein